MFNIALLEHARCEDLVTQFEPINDVHAFYDMPKCREITFVVRLWRVAERIAGPAGIEARRSPGKVLPEILQRRPNIFRI